MSEVKESNSLIARCSLVSAVSNGEASIASQLAKVLRTCPITHQEASVSAPPLPLRRYYLLGWHSLLALLSCTVRTVCHFHPKTAIIHSLLGTALVYTLSLSGYCNQLDVLSNYEQFSCSFFFGRQQATTILEQRLSTSKDHKNNIFNTIKPLAILVRMDDFVQRVIEPLCNYSRNQFVSY